MDEKYIKLFQEITKVVASSAEAVMDYDRQKGDEAGLKAATQMRDDFLALNANITKDHIFTKKEVGLLFIGATVVASQVQSQIENLKKALVGYQTDVLPKLKKINDEAVDDPGATQMLNQIFILDNND